MPQRLALLALFGLTLPATAQDDCVPAMTPEGNPIYETSSGHLVSIFPDYDGLTITYDGVEQRCAMTTSGRENARLGDTWFSANDVHCKSFDAQLSFFTPRNSEDMMMTFDGMMFYPKCED